MGAFSIASMTQGISGNKRTVQAVITGASSYATGGDTVSLTTLGFKQIDSIRLPSHLADGGSNPGLGSAISNAQAQTGKTLQFVPATTGGGTPKIKVYDTANTEVTNATNLSTISWVVTFVGS